MARVGALMRKGTEAVGDHLTDCPNAKEMVQAENRLETGAETQSSSVMTCVSCHRTASTMQEKGSLDGCRRTTETE